MQPNTFVLVSPKYPVPSHYCFEDHLVLGMSDGREIEFGKRSSDGHTRYRLSGWGLTMLLTVEEYREIETSNRQDLFLFDETFIKALLLLTKDDPSRLARALNTIYDHTLEKGEEQGTSKLRWQLRDLLGVK